MASVHRKGEVFEFLNFLFFGFFPFDFPLLFFLFRTSSISSISRLIKSPFFVATNEVARKHRPSPDDDDDDDDDEAEEKKNQPPFFVVFFV